MVRDFQLKIQLGLGMSRKGYHITPFVTGITVTLPIDMVTKLGLTIALNSIMSHQPQHLCVSYRKQLVGPN